ncbi:MAG: VCBS repeat-containing protein [Verrucomicrobiae bacterium]|nr:VCBS repeat-containing protein [Verrucomicrobiae bacterium]
MIHNLALSIRLIFLLASLSLWHGLNAAWNRHTIDDTSKGADGVRLEDVNGDGLMDIATGWEEGGLVRIYLNPGKDKVHSPWPSVTVGHVKSPEDAVFADMDRDGIMDVVSACEGKTRSVFVHWAPKNKHDYLNASKWETEAIPSLEKESMWMFCQPARIDKNTSIDLVVGSKGEKASIGWLEAPRVGRLLEDWKWHPIYEAGWIMSIMTFDADQDGDQDILISDRRKSNSGVVLLENPHDNVQGERPLTWKEHRVGPTGSEVLFIDYSHPTQEPKMTVWASVKPDIIWQLKSPNPFSEIWKREIFQMPDWMSRSKAVRHGDLNMDGGMDLVVNCEGAEGGKSGMAWFTPTSSINGPKAKPAFHDIAGPQGIKFDRIELLDLDMDGDLDVMTCEERENLGVVWYENPHIK